MFSGYFWHPLRISMSTVPGVGAHLFFKKMMSAFYKLLYNTKSVQIVQMAS